MFENPVLYSHITYAYNATLTTRCTGGSPLRRISGASKGDTNGFFIMGVQGVLISARHPERNGSKPSGNSLEPCGISSEVGTAFGCPLVDLAAGDDEAGVWLSSDCSQLEAPCVMSPNSTAVSWPRALSVSSCCMGCTDSRSEPETKQEVVKLKVL